MLKRWSLVVIMLLTTILPAAPAHAQLEGCIVSVSPTSVAPGAQVVFTFGIYNPSTNPMAWVQITPPAGNYLSLDAAGASSWQADIAGGAAIFTQNTLPSGSSQGFDVMATAANTNTGALAWQVLVSDDPGGADPITCDGDQSFSIQTQPSVINLSNVSVTNVSPTTVSVIWDSDTPSTSQVAYGLDANYGQTTPLKTALQTSHSVVLSGLTPNTAYHYAVTSTTPADGGTSASGDNTFLTAIVQAPVFVTVPSGANVPGVVIKATPTEKVPPAISLATSFAAPFRAAPLISGQAIDNEAVARIEYSVDGGKNWLPADNVARTGKANKATAAKVTFSFTPTLADDGNYVLVARATDSSGNTAVTAAQTLIIDRLPPQLGPLVISYGPEVLTPDNQGFINLLAGSDYKFSGSAVGGPISLALEATLTGSKAPATVFGLTQSADSGLWNGVMSFAQGGTYQLSARGLDGAGNKTLRPIATIVVMPAGRAIDTRSKQTVPGALLTLHYLEPATHTWQVWDGAPYGQLNPQRTQVDGNYSLVVPEGTYYLTAQAPLYHTFTSDIFTVSRPSGLSSVINLRPMAHLTIGRLNLHLPDLSWGSQPLVITSAQATADQSVGRLVGQALPDFNLPTTAGTTKRNLDLEGKPTVLTLVTTWSPDSQSQLPALAAAQANTDVNVVPIFSQEHPQLVTSYLATAGYQLTGLVDADGLLIAPLQIGSLPQHVFIDRTGHIKRVMLGVLSKDEILSQLGRL